MAEEFIDELSRQLIDQIDRRLRDAERLRNQAEQRRHHRPFWPDRRGIERISDSRREESDETPER